MHVLSTRLCVPDRYSLGSAKQFECGHRVMAVPASLQRSPVFCPRTPNYKRIPLLLHRKRGILTTYASSGSNNNGSKNRSSGPSSSSSPQNENSGFFSVVCNSFSEFIGRTLYKYYNWRQDTLSDLQLFIILNAGLIGIGAVLRRQLAPASISSLAPLSSPSDLAPPGADMVTPPTWWQDLYSVLTVVLGQELPEEQASNFPQQLFAVATAVLGVASFALVLALIEQATLELLENNVRRGSRVYEKDHYVILTYGESARDLRQTETILKQICAASASSGGAVIVVLVAHREKLEMETLCRETLPMESRYGSQIVFRQGSPLDPGALDMVSAVDARAIIITGDYSRSVEDSDAQVLRCAVLVDEMTAAAGKEWISDSTINNGSTSSTSSTFSTTSNTSNIGPWVVAEVQGTNVPALLQYACSSRVIPVPSSTINARRYARLLKHPVVATLSHALFDHTSRSNCHIGYFPEATYLVGQTFAHIHAFFPNAIVAGVIDCATWHTELSCSPERILQKGEALVMLRPPVGRYTLLPLPYAVPAALDSGKNWDPNSYFLKSFDEAPLGVDASGARVCSWNRNLTSLNSNGSNSNGSMSMNYEGPRAPPPRGPGTTGQSGENYSDTAPPTTATTSWSSSSSLVYPKKLLQIRRKLNKLQGSEDDRLGAALLPLSYGFTANDGTNGSSSEQSRDLLICGWPGSNAMLELLKELDHGVEALPQGSRVILLNNHNFEEISTQCSLSTTIQRLDIKHVKCDPRDRQALESALDVATLRAAVILHDIDWGVSTAFGAIESSTSSFTSPYRAAAAATEASAYFLSQSDMLRIDAAVLEVQLNVRYLLETKCCPDINILSEKLTYLGQTRFEKRSELPIGAAVNSASFAAKVLAQTAVQPRSLAAYAELGVQCEIVVQDAASFAKHGEELNFFTLQARCAAVSQVLLGYYDVPSSIDEILNIVVNPDEEDRERTRVWNDGKSRCKLITLARRTAKEVPSKEAMAATAVAESTESI